MTGYFSFDFTKKKQIEKERENVILLKIKKNTKQDKNLQMMTKDHKLTAFFPKIL